MTKIEHLNEIINNIPNILQYFVPGVSFIMIIRALSIKRFAENYTIIFSCVISYLFVSFVSTINSLTVNNEIIKEPIAISAISSGIAVIMAVIMSVVFNSKWFKYFTLKCFHKTLYDDIWQDVFDFKNGTNLKLFMKDKDYYIMGHYKFNEEKGDDSWIALSAHSYRDKNDDKVIGRSYETDENVIITIRMCDIEHIEVF